MPQTARNTEELSARRAAFLRARMSSSIRRMGRHRGAVIRRLGQSVGKTSIWFGARWGRTSAIQELLTPSILPREAKFGLGTSGGGGGSPGSDTCSRANIALDKVC